MGYPTVLYESTKKRRKIFWLAQGQESYQWSMCVSLSVPAHSTRAGTKLYDDRTSTFYMYGVQYIVLTCIFLHASWQLKHSPTSIGRNEKVVQLLCELPGEPCWWIRALEQRETCPHVLLPNRCSRNSG